jgi:hypothetical protein
MEEVERFKQLKLGINKNNQILFFFRGHSDHRWDCLPGIARPPYTPNAIYTFDENAESRDTAEWVLFSRFRDMSASLEPGWIASVGEVEADWRRLVLAQHHKLPTRLLDWTTKSLVALYFAVQDYRTESTKGVDAAVLVITRHRPEVFSLRALATRNPNPPCYAYDNGREDTVGVFWAPDIHQRVTLQGSAFSIGRDPWQPVEPEGRFVISGCERDAIRNELYHLGIHEASLFPDLDGIARSLYAESKTWGSNHGVDPV